MRILLLGSTGMLGCTLCPFLNSQGYDVITHSRNKNSHHQAELSDPAETDRLLNQVAPDFIINLTGLTNVDACDEEPNMAYLVNVRSVENLANWISRKKPSCHLMHISTDQVYDGEGLHKEESVSLKNYYAFSKYAGELAAARVSATIIRTNFFGRSNCPERVSISDWIFNSLTKNEEIHVFDDVVFSPLSLSTLSEMIGLCVQQRPSGIFNVGSREGMSKADFAFALAKGFNLSTGIMNRTTTDQVTFLKTYRPKNMEMDSSRFENSMKITLPTLREEIKLVAKEYL